MSLESLLDQKKRLAQKMTTLERKAKVIKEKERKLAVKNLIAMGNLFAKAELDSLEKETLLGALLEIKESVDPETLKRWQEKGRVFLEKSAADSPTTLIIRLLDYIPDEIKSYLRENQFKWNPFRKEWNGYGQKENLAEFLKEKNAKFEIIDVDR